MAIGAVWFKTTERWLPEHAGRPHPISAEERSKGWRIVLIGSLAVIVLGLVMFMGLIPVTVTQLAQAFGTAMIALAFFFFGYVLIFAKITTQERKRVGVIAVFFLCAAVFWAGFEQQATTFNLFALDFTDRSWLGGMFPDGVHPASWYQSANPIFIILFAPFFAYVWVALGKRNLDPAAPAKFGLGLLLLGVGFLVMMFASQLVVATGDSVAPTWLLLAYLVHTFGELCLSPVGLSNVTKLAPPRYVGQMMGTWFLGSAVGNLFAGLIGGHMGASDASALPGQFLQMALVGCGAGAAMLLLTPVFKKMMGGVR